MVKDCHAARKIHQKSKKKGEDVDVTKLKHFNQVFLSTKSTATHLSSKVDQSEEECDNIGENNQYHTDVHKYFLGVPIILRGWDKVGDDS